MIHDTGFWQWWSYGGSMEDFSKDKVVQAHMEFEM
jgi:hypothetical protein